MQSAARCPMLLCEACPPRRASLPFGTPEDVRREVAENIEILGRSRGYIVAPCHNIQPITPTENILALYEAVAEYG